MYDWYLKNEINRQNLKEVEEKKRYGFSVKRNLIYL